MMQSYISGEMDGGMTKNLHPYLQDVRSSEVAAEAHVILLTGLHKSSILCKIHFMGVF